MASRGVSIFEEIKSGGNTDIENFARSSMINRWENTRKEEVFAGRDFIFAIVFYHFREALSSRNGLKREFGKVYATKLVFQRKRPQERDSWSYHIQYFYTLHDLGKKTDNCQYRSCSLLVTHSATALTIPSSNPV